MGAACSRPYLPTLGALTGNQAVQQVRAGLEAIYISGWQVAADANTAGQMYPDQSLYPVDSVPALVRNQRRVPAPDQIVTAKEEKDIHWLPRSWPTPRPASVAPSTPSS